MKQSLLALLALCALSGAALAATKATGPKPTEAQNAEFYKTCMGIAQDATLCRCKADAAMTLVDADFMDVIISSMKGKAPPTADNLKYGIYIGQSNKICKPNY